MLIRKGISFAPNVQIFHLLSTGWNRIEIKLRFENSQGFAFSRKQFYEPGKKTLQQGAHVAERALGTEQKRMCVSQVEDHGVIHKFGYFPQLQ